MFQYTVTTLGRLSDVEQFENIIVKTGDGGRITRLSDVARVELGAQTYDQFNAQAGQPTANIGIYQLPGATRSTSQRGRRSSQDEQLRAFPRA